MFRVLPPSVYDSIFIKQILRLGLRSAYVYRIAKSVSLITFLPHLVHVILLLVSVLAIFIAGLGANFEFSLKRIIPLSTLRQLRLMIITISIGLSGLAFFHLLTHALFKSLLYHL